MNLHNKKSSPNKTGSGTEMTKQDIGLARFLAPARVDLADCKLQGWDFREFAAFLRAQDDSWVQRTGP